MRIVERPSGRSGFQLPELIDRLLYSRGIRTEEALEEYFNPRYSKISCFTNKEMVRPVADFIRECISSGEMLAIYGDYDVDGITASAILKKTVERLGGKVMNYIPNRFEEGYGIRKEGLDKLASAGIKKAVSVDCGISSAAEAEYAVRLGIELVITDHHEIPEILPGGLCYDPKTGSPDSAAYDLSAAGIAFFIAMDLLGHPVPDDFVKELTALSALGTIADIVPMTKDNRIIASLGINAINSLYIRGIEEILSVASVKKPVDAWHVSFVIAPRLNAAGRFTTAQTAFEIFFSGDPLVTARALDSVNAERRALQEEIFKHARTAAAGETGPSIILSSPEFNRGVNGIVASKIVEEFRKPAFLFEESEGVLYGSGRSVGDIDLTAVLKQCREFFLSFGGHKMAAGARMEAAAFPAFKKKFIETLFAMYGDILDAEETVLVDMRAEIADFNAEVFRLMDKMAPFGTDNPKPVFFFEGVKILNGPRILKDKYKFYEASQGGVPFEICDWSGRSGFGRNDTIGVLGFPFLDNFRNRRQVKINLYKSI